jgi:predicted dehydrogenase
MTRLTRRRFLAAAAAVAAPVVVPASVFGARSPSNRINIGCIGVGNQGSQVMQGLMQQADAQIVMVCDVNTASGGYKSADQFLGRDPARRMAEDHYAADRPSGTYRGCDACIDFREVLARPDIDAVTIVVPDHWHAVMAVLAARAGKDMYCEKPLSLTVEDGQAMIRAVRRHSVILQTGSHERSRPLSRFACELVRNGRIGRLKRITAMVGPHNKQAPPAHWQPMPVPDGFDYERWLGPAPWAPYHKDRCLYNFRFILDYSGGQTTNYGAHSLDLAQWGAGRDHTAPVEFADAGSEWPRDGLFDAATRVAFRARYADGLELECVTRPDNMSVLFEGTEGSVQTGYSGFHTQPESLKRSVIGPGEIRLGASNNHYRDFLDAVRARRDPAAPVELGHRTATLCHCGNIAMRLGRTVRWDPVAERFPGDDEANRLLGAAKRGPWTI